MLKLVLTLFLSLQVLFWYDSYQIKPELGVMPKLPSARELEALSFGDKQVYFRMQALRLQMAGDTWGRSTPLKNYNYPMLLEWFRLMDMLDDKSNYIPSMAAYYYSRSQNTSDVKYVLDYLEERSFKDIEHNWWWLSQSIYLANGVLGDKERAIKIASKLREVKSEIPIWARQMEAFLQEDLGEKGKAEDIMCEVFRTAKNIPQRELDFMADFLFERLGIKLTDSDEKVQNRLSMVAKICYNQK